MVSWLKSVVVVEGHKSIRPITYTEISLSVVS